MVAIAGVLVVGKEIVGGPLLDGVLDVVLEGLEVDAGVDAFSG